VDTEAYQPLDRNDCRRILGIPYERKVVMFAAAALNAANKGGELLSSALDRLPSRLKPLVTLLLVGDGGEHLERRMSVDTVNLGYLRHDRLKSLAYSAADLFVLPSRGESLSLVLQESMSCGTPMVAFRAGGMVDLVRPGITGYLAERDDADDFCAGITKLLEDDELRASMSRQCRKVAVQEYSLGLHVRRHIELYRQLSSN
jgi:glycosyltransferase involved in cell wall biosynthesis